jgi:hypothetical protein
VPGREYFLPRISCPASASWRQLGLLTFCRPPPGSNSRKKRFVGVGGGQKAKHWQIDSAGQHDREFTKHRLETGARRDP